MGIIICFITLSVLVVFSFVYHYIQAQNLCAYLREDNTEKALETVDRMRNVNWHTSPLWTEAILNMAETGVDIPLVVACEEGNYEVVKALLEKGADPNRSFDGHMSPIEVTYARKNENRYEITKLLIEHGADVDKYSSYNTALFEEIKLLAYGKGSDKEWKETAKKCIVLLIENGAKTVENDGTTVTHYLCMGGEIEILQMIDGYENQLNARDNKGRTPLMWAVINEKVNAVEFLLGVCTDINATDNDGKTALDYATETGNKEIIDLLS